MMTELDGNEVAAMAMEMMTAGAGVGGGFSYPLAEGFPSTIGIATPMSKAT